MQTKTTLTGRRSRVSKIAALQVPFAVLATLLLWSTLVVGQSPPFTQCPAIGLDTSCGVLISITDSGANCLTDPSQGPYDGIEDTLIGVQNNSSSPVASLTVSSTLPAFAFDGDGICAFVLNSGCGATGYEGPGTSFSGISGDLKSGTVNFTPALAPGASTYFSLEEAITCATISNITVTSSLTLSPAVATNFVGQTHTVTACVTSNNVPLANVTIAFDVTGANAASGSCVTDTNGSGCCSFSYTGSNVGSDTITASAIVAGQTNTASASKIWLPSPCPTCNGSAVVVAGNVTINFNTATPTYSGDPALLPYFSFDKSGASPSSWKAIFDVGGASLLITSNATITTTQVPPGTNNRKAPGIEIHSTCTLQIDQGSSVVVASLNQQAGNIAIEVDGAITINGVVSDSVGGTRGRPGNITIGSSCGNITTGPQSKVVTYGDDFGGSDINIGSCDSGDIAIHGLVDASYNGSTPSTIRIASFGGSVLIDGTNPFGTEVVAGTLRTITSGVCVRSRRDPDPGTIEIQADQNIVVEGSTLLSKKNPNYGAVAIKTASNSSKGGLIDARAINGSIVAIDRAFDDANRYNAAAQINLQAGSDIGLSVSGSINNGASDNSKAVVSTQGGSSGNGGTDLLRSFNGSINISSNAQVLANFAGTPGANGANLLTACVGVNNAGTVLPADANASDDSGVCGGTPDLSLLDCGDLGIVFPQSQ